MANLASEMYPEKVLALPEVPTNFYGVPTAICWIRGALSYSSPSTYSWPWPPSWISFLSDFAFIYVIYLHYISIYWPVASLHHCFLVHSTACRPVAPTDIQLQWRLHCAGAFVIATPIAHSSPQECVYIKQARRRARMLVKA